MKSKNKKTKVSKEQKKIERRKFIKENKKTLIKGLVASVFLLIAVISITRGCSRYFVSTTGYKEIDLAYITDDKDEIVYPYAGEILLYYYCSTTGIEQNNEKKMVAASYNTALAEIGRYTDSVHTFKTSEDKTLANIAYINKHPNEEIVVDEILYDILKSAYGYMSSTNNEFNLYAGYLEDFWTYVLQMQSLGVEVATLDPNISALKAEELERIVNKLNAYTNDATQGLKFNDENSSVTFVVDITYSGYVKLDLQYLEHTYAMEYIAQTMEKEYSGATLISAYGYAKSIGKSRENIEETYSQSYSVPNGNTWDIMNTKSISSVMVCEYSYYYYIGIDEHENKYPRHMFYSAVTGEAKNTLKAFASFDSTKTLDALCIESFMQFNTTLNEAKEYVKNSQSDGYYFIVDEPLDNAYVVYYSSNVEDIKTSLTLESVKIS